MRFSGSADACAVDHASLSGVPAPRSPASDEGAKFTFRRESHPSARLTPPGLITASWFCLLAFCLFLATGQKGFGQSMTLSAPSSSGSFVDNGAVVFSISGETGTISSVRVVMTYLSGFSTASIGSTWTMTMFSISATQSFSFNPSTAMSSALFRSVSQADAGGNAVTPATNPPDGVYSFYVQYTRASGVTVRSNTATAVTVDTGALPPSFSYAPLAFLIDPTTDTLWLGTSVVITLATDVITLANHGLAADRAVNISGTNLSSTTTYYVSVIDSNSFKLATTAGGSTYADVTSGTSATISVSSAPHSLAAGTAVQISGTNLSPTTTYYASLVDDRYLKLATTSGGSTYADFWDGSNGTISSVSAPTAITIDPATDVITLANHGFAANAAVTVSGTNLPSATTYYVSVIDSNSFKLATTSGGSTYADIATGTTGTIGSNAVTIDPATDIITRASHGFAANAMVNISGTNLDSTRTYYVSVIDTGSFRLATTSSGTTYADFLPLTSATIRSASSSPVTTPVTIASAPDTITRANHGLAADTAVTISGTNLPSTTTYYVSVIDSNSFKLVTSSRGSTVADFSSTATGGGTLTPTLGYVLTLGTNLAKFYYSIPESYATTSARITFTGRTTVVVTVPNGVRNNTLVFDRSNISVPGFASTSTTLPDDTYTVTLTYRDLFSHNSTAVTLIHMSYDAGTVAPSFTSLVANAAITDGSTIPYTLPEAPYGGTVKLTFSNGTTTTVIPLTNARSGTFTYDRALHAALIPTGTYTVTLSYQDTAGNTVTSTSVTGVSITVEPLTATTDTDGDGLNDLAELKLVALGFDWQVAQSALVDAFLNDSSLYTLVEFDTNRTAGQGDVTTAPADFSLFTQAQIDSTRTAGRADVTGSPATYSLFTHAQIDSTRLAGRADVTTAPADFSLFTQAQIDSTRTAGQTDVTLDPATYNLVTTADAQTQAAAARLTGRADVTGAPATYSLFTQAQIDSTRLAGRADVTTAPADFSLFTQAQIDSTRIAGQADVTAAPATFSLFTQAQIDSTRLAGRADVTTAPADFNLFTQAQIDSTRLAGRADVTSAPATYNLFTADQVQDESAAARLVGRADVTNSPATYSLFTQAQIDSTRLAGRADVTTAPADFSLFTQAQIDSTRTAGQTDVTSAPATYNLVTTADAQTQANAARLSGRADVTGAPATYDLFTTTQVAASRTAGQTDVTSAPATYNLFTAAQVQDESAAARLVGRADVTSSPATFSLFTQAQINSTRLAGQADVTGNPNTFNLYTLTEVESLNLVPPILSRDPVTQKWKLTIEIQRSTNLINYTTLPFTAADTVVNADGKIEFVFTVPDPNVFFRLHAR